MLADFTEFHLVRPAWLLAILPALWIWWRARHVKPHRAERFKGIAPHLAVAMTIGGNRRGKFLPIDGLIVLVILLAFGAAGPTWSRVDTPFSAQTAPLVVVLSVSESMEGRDMAPSRLSRARQKILDVLATRSGARTALIAYAGTAHRVVPLTEDPAVLKPFLESLSPEVMPKAGNNATAALAAAKSLLADEPERGVVLWVADVIDPADAAAFDQQRAEGGAPVIALPVSRDGAEIESFERAGIETITLTADDADVARIERRVAQAWREALTDGDEQVWEDRGWLLAWPAALLVLFWFRRGWTMRWAAGVLLAAAIMPMGNARADGLGSWFFTSDQRGRMAYEKKAFAEAAELFADPAWRGHAQYRAGQYEAAAETLARVETPEAAFTAGLALIKSRQYRPAIAAFEVALERDPDFPGAARNLEVARAILLYVEQARAQSDTGEESGIGADDVVFDNKSGRGVDTQIANPDDVAPQTADQWMRTVDTDAADFLRSRFALEVARPPQ